MKKYLMTAFAAVAMGAAFTSCSHNDDEYQPAPEKTDAEKLESAFESTFGKIDPTNDWGFGNAALARGTRGVNKNTNEYATFVEVPDKLTDTQKGIVRNWFQTHPNPEGIAVNWSDFFVQQVYKGHTTPIETCPEEYTAKNGGKVIGSDKMNKLTCGTANEHVNDFNNGNRGNSNVAWKLGPNYNPVNNQNDLIYHEDQITFMVNSSTECFGYHNSESNEQRNDKYVIIPGDLIDPAVAGMYFVGLDFAANGANPNQQVDADGYYSDWIVKITPGLYRNDKTYRIFAEDLIGENLDDIQASDWDFNDAVFDVWKDDKNNDEDKKIVVILYAAGGTKKLTVGGKEVHEQFGVSVTTMVNTEGASVEKPVAIFRLSGSFSNPNEIKVILEDNIELTATTGNVPMKLCVPTGTKWLKEKTLISKGYPEFPEYVKNASAHSTWYNNAVNSYLVSK